MGQGHHKVIIRTNYDGPGFNAQCYMSRFKVIGLVFLPKQRMGVAAIFTGLFFSLWVNKYSEFK